MTSERMSRRGLLRFGAGAVTASGAAPGLAATHGDLADFWDVDRTVANFDAAYYGAMPRATAAAYLANLRWVNRHHSTFLRSAVNARPRDPALDASRRAVADLIGAGADEIALCGGGTEALYALITNYRRLKAGDAVILADVDYDEMQYAMAFLKESRGAEVVRVSLPEPPTAADVLAAYEKVLKAPPRAKLLLLTHVSNRHGLIPPVREIIAMARTRGVDVILDSAQAVGQLPVDVDALGADFVGFSLHKWLAAPLGTGGVYIRKSRQADVAPYMGNGLIDPADVRSRILTGTINVAAHLTIPDAIAVHRQLGAEPKLKRLQAMRDYWMDRVRDVPGLRLAGPGPGDPYGAIGAFRPAGMATPHDARKMQARLLAGHGVLVVAKAGLAAGPVLRVTPALFNTQDELDRLVTAIRSEFGAT